MHPWPMIPRSRLLAVAALGALVLLVGACGEAEIIPLPTRDLAEPWQPRPFAVDPTLIAAAERICRDPGRGNPNVLPLVVVDTRGANRLILLFGGRAETAECFVTRDRAGQLMVDGGGGSSSVPPPPAPQPVEVRFNGAGSNHGPEGPWSYGIGEAGPAVASVELTPLSGVLVQASLNRGWFVAWWPGLNDDAMIGVRGYDAAGRLVGTSP